MRSRSPDFMQAHLELPISKSRRQGVLPTSSLRMCSPELEVLKPRAAGRLIIYIYLYMYMHTCNICICISIYAHIYIYMCVLIGLAFFDSPIVVVVQGILGTHSQPAAGQVCGLSTVGGSS